MRNIILNSNISDEEIEAVDETYVSFSYRSIQTESLECSSNAGIAKLRNMVEDMNAVENNWNELNRIGCKYVVYYFSFVGIDV